jgi:hypothetical protein
MKLAIFALLLSITSSSCSQQLEMIADFIKSSKDKTISFITFDTAINESLEIAENFPHTPKTVFKIPTRALDNCTNYANIDFYIDAVSTTVFHHQENWLLVETLARMEFNDFVVFASWELIGSVLKCLTQPLARFLLIANTTTTINEAHAIRQLTNILNRTWVENGALNVFLSSHEKLFTFDPFHRNDDGSHGKLNSFAVSFESVGGKLKKLNGYPLRVDLFYSTYTMGRVKQPKSVQDYEGPDVDVARLTSEKLNATSLSLRSAQMCNNRNHIPSLSLSLSLFLLFSSRFGEERWRKVRIQAA